MLDFQIEVVNRISNGRLILDVGYSERKVQWILDVGYSNPNLMKLCNWAQVAITTAKIEHSIVQGSKFSPSSYYNCKIKTPIYSVVINTWAQNLNFT